MDGQFIHFKYYHTEAVCQRLILKSASAPFQLLTFCLQSSLFFHPPFFLSVILQTVALLLAYLIIIVMQRYASVPTHRRVLCLPSCCFVLRDLVCLQHERWSLCRSLSRVGLIRATPHIHHNPNITITETITMLHKEHEGLSVGLAETILTQKNQEQIIKTCM